MKLSKLALAAAVACGINAGNLTAGQANDIQLVSSAEAPCDCGEPVCGCEPVLGCEDGCDGLCDGGCDSAYGCGSGCSPLGGLGGGCLGECDLGDPFSLFGEHCGYTAGGWIQMGYHNNALPLFNSRPDEYQLHQAWLYAEKAIDTSNGFDLGGRIDYMYGTDSQDTQAFGTGPRGWDNDWDNGADYGFALPQLYMEAGYGDLSVIAGHFYTIIGWEVVPAPDNFFYSHAYTMYNSEPFTHTGVLATYGLSDDIEVYGGYTLGWDSGFDDNGDSFLGGTSVTLTEDWSMTYATVAGRFGEARFNGVEKGYMHSIVSQYALSDNLQYIAQSDILDTEDAAGNTVRETYGYNQYLIYTLSDCLAIGGRFEWWQVQADSAGYYGDNANLGNLPAGFDVNAEEFDIYALTLGLNYRPHANVVVRPEIRWDWVDGNTDALAAVDNEILEGNDDDQTTFGIDTIFLF